jgi:hypothetical protein
MIEPIGKCFSLGRLVERLRRPPTLIEVAIVDLKIMPMIVLNGLEYFHESHEPAIDEYLRHRDAERILGRPIPPA